MNLVLTGYKQLKDCKGGELIRFADGTFAMMSIYDSGSNSDNNIKASYLWGSGDAMGAGQDPNEWVADTVELTAVDGKLTCKVIKRINIGTIAPTSTSVRHNIGGLSQLHIIAEYATPAELINAVLSFQRFLMEHKINVPYKKFTSAGNSQLYGMPITLGYDAASLLHDYINEFPITWKYEDNED